MAGDWIKVRVLIGKDPKVLAMADYLALDRSYMDWLTNPVRQKCKESAYEHVAPAVIAQQVVAGLVAVWGIANEHGKPDGDDLLLDHATLHGLDDIAGIPGFGDAMVAVGWAVEESDQVSKQPNSNVTRAVTVRFPRFMISNVPAKDRQEKLSRERQARYRAKKGEMERYSNVTNDVTSSSLLLSVREGEEVNHQPEKRGEGVGEGATEPAQRTVEQAEAGFAAFWQAWPNKVNERKAKVAWFLLGPPDPPLVAEILAGVKRYGSRKPPDQRWMNPETFLDGCRWRDEPAPVGRGPPGSGRVETPEQRLQRVERDNAEERKRSAEAPRVKLDVNAARAAKGVKS